MSVDPAADVLVGAAIREYYLKSRQSVQA